ncbi:MAG: hypothetical protein ACM3JB_15965 [Acidobacteriaceae bacterium]
MTRTLLLIALLVSTAGSLFGQSLGDVARENRNKQGAKAKVVVDDDTGPIQSNKSPFPNMAVQGLDNTDEIIGSMEKYRASHTPEEFEGTLRSWYESYDTMMADALADQRAIRDRHNERVRGIQENTLDRTNDYAQYQKRRESELRTDEDDRKRSEADGLLTARIQQMFVKVRNNFMMKGVRYEWFKIRFGNNNGSY